MDKYQIEENFVLLHFIDMGFILLFSLASPVPHL